MVPGSEIPVKKMGSEYTSPNQDQRGSTHYSNTIAKNMPDSESLAFIDHNNLILYRLIHKYLIPPHPIRRENMSKKSDMPGEKRRKIVVIQLRRRGYGDVEKIRHACEKMRKNRL
jgi:hypothetical protein